MAFYSNSGLRLLVKEQSVLLFVCLPPIQRCLDMEVFCMVRRTDSDTYDPQTIAQSRRSPYVYIY